MKNPLTPAGIEPATFQFVTQHLNHCATAVPRIMQYIPKFQVTCLHYLQPTFISLLPSIHTFFRQSVHLVFVLSLHLPSINPVGA